MVRIKFYVFYVTKYMLGLQVGVTTFFTFQYATERLIYCIGCEFGLCPFYPFPLSSIVPGLVWSTSLTIASLSSIGTLSRHQSPDDPSPIQFELGLIWLKIFSVINIWHKEIPSEIVILINWKQWVSLTCVGSARASFTRTMLLTNSRTTCFANVCCALSPLL